MKSRYVVLGSLLNLLTLAIGMFLGLYLSASHPGLVRAQNQPEIQPITPVATVGSIGSLLVLAHEVQTDSLVVNGYDVMKLQQGILNYLGTQITANPTGLQAIVEGARAKKLYTVKPPAAAQPSPKEKKP